jgi:hypothetical protein
MMRKLYNAPGAFITWLTIDENGTKTHKIDKKALLALLWMVAYPAEDRRPSLQEFLKEI